MCKRVKKPWGAYDDFFRSEKLVCKQIEINPGEEISYQSHKKRAEIWFVLSGLSEITLDGHTKQIGENNSFYDRVIAVNFNEKHQIKNIGHEPLIIYEMQIGLCEEKDITRYSDKYGRG